MCVYIGIDEIKECILNNVRADGLHHNHTALHRSSELFCSASADIYFTYNHAHMLAYTWMISYIHIPTNRQNTYPHTYTLRKSFAVVHECQCPLARIYMWITKHTHDCVCSCKVSTHTHNHAHTCYTCYTYTHMHSCTPQAHLFTRAHTHQWTIARAPNYPQGSKRHTLRHTNT